jgi:branched-chain amino acid transport system ATP-binding protein
MSASSSIGLELSHLDAGYGRLQVLWDVSIRVGPGRVVALLGANGAGKTTLLKVAAGTLSPWRGTIRLGDEDVSGADAVRRARGGICLIPEGRGIFRSLTVRENLALQIPPWSARRSVDEALEIFPVLGRRLGQIAGTMSGGEQQMLALSRAYLADPAIVLLDEVSLGLAPIIIDELFESIRRLAAMGRSLLLVEQYVPRALEIADDAYVLRQGAIDYAGPASELQTESVIESYMGAALDAETSP